jgi:hypothetical protein
VTTAGIYTPQGDMKWFQCKEPSCSGDSCWPAKPVLDALLPFVDEGTCWLASKQLSSERLRCPRCGSANTFANLRGGDWFSHHRFLEGASARLEEWLTKKMGKGKKLVVLELGCGMNTPTVTRLPMEAVVRAFNKAPSSSSSSSPSSSSSSSSSSSDQGGGGEGGGGRQGGATLLRMNQPADAAVGPSVPFPEGMSLAGGWRSVERLNALLDLCEEGGGGGGGGGGGSGDDGGAQQVRGVLRALLRAAAGKGAAGRTEEESEVAEEEKEEIEDSTAATAALSPVLLAAELAAAAAAAHNALNTSGGRRAAQWRELSVRYQRNPWQAYLAQLRR